MTRAIVGLIGLIGVGVAGFVGYRMIDAPEERSQSATPPQAAIQEVQTAQVQATREVDWPSVRDDFAVQGAAPDMARVQVATTDGRPSPVPVLVPTGIVTPQGANRPLVRYTEDGYFASFPGVEYDIIVNGTTLIYGTDAPAEADDDTGYVFTKTKSGASLAMVRYNVDYLIEFECQVIEADTSCIDEAEAIEVAENLVLTEAR